MEETVVCPNCGESNPSDLLYCEHCQWRLRPIASDWGNDLGSGPGRQPSDDAEQGYEVQPVPDWLRLAREQAEPGPVIPMAPINLEAASVSPSADDDLLEGLAHQSESAQEELPEWVARIMGLSESREASNVPGPVAQSPAPGVDSEKAPPPSAQLPDIGRDVPDTGEAAEPIWPSAQLDRPELLGPAESAAPFDQQATLERLGNENAEIYEWLRQLDATATTAEADEAPKTAELSTPLDVPKWVDDMMGVPGGPEQEAAAQVDTVPDWLVDSTSGQRTARAPLGAADLSSSPSTDAEPIDSAPQTAAPSWPAESETPQAVAPFPAEDIQRLDVEAIFASMQMPDWPADADRGQQAESPEAEKTGQDEEPIVPASLPSWVAAMRPPESEQARASEPQEDSGEAERGPLLGLHGVLPAIPGAARASARTKSHSMKLDASEQHQAHARLLEDMLAAETQPLPLKGARAVASQGLLRWAIGALLVTAISGAILSRSTNFPLPSAVPIESNAAIQAIQSLPPDAPVLAVFDYEPAVAGEMEATAASLMDHLLLLKHPRLAIISTSPTGSALAERFMSGVVGDRDYVRGVQYVNMGFLPGGLAGVQFFAQDPTAAVALGAASERVWDSSVLQGVQQLSDFAAIIVLTESLESGRVWIEQTERTRGASPMIVASSAQTGPMLLPYYDSGQVEGLVAGLNGAAGAELANNGLPGLVRRYWDAYSLGMYLAAALITIGAFWHAWAGIRERRLETM